MADTNQVMTENVEARKEGTWLNLERLSAAFNFFLFLCTLPSARASELFNTCVREEWIRRRKAPLDRVLLALRSLGTRVGLVALLRANSGRPYKRISGYT